MREGGDTSGVMHSDEHVSVVRLVDRPIARTPFAEPDAERLFEGTDDALVHEDAREVRTKDAAASLDMVDLVGLQLNPLNHTWYEHANDVAVNYIAEFELRH